MGHNRHILVNSGYLNFSETLLRPYVLFILKPVPDYDLDNHENKWMNDIICLNCDLHGEITTAEESPVLFPSVS